MWSSSEGLAQTCRFNRNLFLVVLETEEFKIKVPTDSVYGEGLLPGLFCVLTQWKSPF